MRSRVEQKIQAQKQEVDLSVMTLVFPVCLKTVDGLYERYCNDGRLEMCSESGGKNTLSFGTIPKEWFDDSFSMLKVVVARHRLITEAEYMEAFKRIVTDAYINFIKGVVVEKDVLEVGELPEVKTQEESRGDCEYPF